MSVEFKIEGRGHTVAGRDIITISAGDRLVQQLYGDQILDTTVDWQYDRFAEPAGYREAADVLRNGRLLLLTADSGARTAALCLLREVHEKSRTIDHVEVEQDTRLQLRRIDADALVLIDFRTVEDTRDIERQIGGFVDQLRDGRVVVLLSGNESEEFRNRLEHLHRHLAAPAPEAVLRAHLHHDLPEDQLTAVLTTHDWHELSRAARPAEVTHLADLIRRSRNEAPSGSPVQKWIDEALIAFHNYSKILSKEFDQAGPMSRTLTLALALVNNGRHESVYWAEQILLEVTGYPEDDSKHVLASEGFLGRLVKIPNATHTAERAWFTRRDYDTSVLHHAWRGFPQLREPIGKWIIEVAFDARVHLDLAVQRSLAERLLALCTENRAAKPLLAAVEKWVSSNGALAAGLLDEAAVDRGTTVDVRRKMYAWATDPQLDVPLARAVIESCAAEFGRLHTHLALTRLGHLANHQRSEIVRRVVSALLALAGEHRKASAVLARATEWLRTGTHPQWVVAAEVVRELTRPGGGYLSGRPDDLATAAWRAILGSAESGAAHDAVREWLDIALEPATRQEALEVLLVAADGEVRSLDLLSMAGYLWHRDDPEARSDVHDELRRQIHARHPAVSQ